MAKPIFQNVYQHRTFSYLLISSRTYTGCSSLHRIHPKGRCLQTAMHKLKPLRREISLLSSSSSSYSYDISDSFKDRNANFLTCRHMSNQGINYYVSPEFPPIGFAQKFLETAHDFTGLPWWGSIIATTFFLRTFVTLPFSIYSTKLMAKVESLQPEIMANKKHLKMEVAHAMKKNGWTNKKANIVFAQNMRRVVRDMYVRENCHPLKTTVVAWVQLPLWISVSFALRNMAGALPLPGGGAVSVLTPALSVGGALWFPDLLLPDATLALPLIMAAANLAVNEMHSLRTERQHGLARGITVFMRGVCLVMIPIAASVPSCMCLYWTCSSVYGLIQNVAIRFPTIRRKIGILKTPNESETPFKDMLRNAKVRYGRTKSKTVENE